MPSGCSEDGSRPGLHSYLHHTLSEEDRQIYSVPWIQIYKGPTSDSNPDILRGIE